MGCLMYRKNDENQIVMAEFALPFGGKLDVNNRWIQLEKRMPWSHIEEIYAASMCLNNGRNALPARVAFGAIFIKESENLSDEGCVLAIAENPYMQYFLGLKEFSSKPLFSASMMVHFRKRFPMEEVNKINEYICTGVWPKKQDDQDDHNDPDGDGGQDRPEAAPKTLKGKRNPNTSKKKTKRKKDRGTLVLDATVAPADIKYPTDIDLLNQCREHLETAVDYLWKRVEHKGHKLPYSTKKARKSYLNISKSKKWTHKKLQKGIREQLEYIRLARLRLNQMLLQVPAKNVDFPSWLWHRLCVVPLVYEQQKTMLENRTHACENRIVSLQQPHVRPIVRGKRPEPTEFGQKLHLAIVDGYTYMEHSDWNAYNEGSRLPAAIKTYWKRFGHYPAAVLCDRIYQTRENRAYCKERDIRLSAPPLGRRSAMMTEASVRRQLYRDSCERNIVEGRIGTMKRRYGLDLIMSKLEGSSKTEAALNILAMNAALWLRRWLLRFWFILAPYPVFQ